MKWRRKRAKKEGRTDKRTEIRATRNRNKEQKRKIEEI